MKNILHSRTGLYWLKFLVTTEASHVGYLYAISIVIISIVGLASAAVLLLELATPTPNLLNSSLFGTVLTLHGMIMVFLVLLPLLPAVLGNFIIPHGVGANNIAHPRLNLVGWYLYTLGSLAVIIGIELSGYQGGWKMNLPSEFDNKATFAVMLVGLLAVVLSSFLMNLVLVKTILNKRYRSVKLSTIPLYVWFFLFGSFLHLLVVPFRIFYLLLQFESNFSQDIMLFFGLNDLTIFKHHLFWMYTNPSIFSTLLPVIGIACAVINGNDKYSRHVNHILLACGMAISLLCLVSWGQHMLTTFEKSFMSLTGSMYGILTIIPLMIIFGILLQSWLRYKPLQVESNILLFGQATSFVFLGLSSILLTTPSVGVFLHNTYSTVSHLHFGAVGIGIIGFFTGVYHWRYLLSSRIHNIKRTKVWLYGIVAGVHLTFLPMLLIGFKGVPRAYYSYDAESHFAHLITAIGGSILIISICAWIVGLLRNGRHSKIS